MTLLFILVVLFILELVYFQIADHYDIIDRPNERSSHREVVLRGGGIIFTMGMWLWAMAYGFEYPWFLAGLTLIAAVSFIDDIRSLPDSVRLLAQFVAMILMMQDLGLLTLSNWWLVILALIFCVGTTNAYNFMDGINGITGGYSIAVLLPLLWLDTDPAGIPFVKVPLLWVALLSCIVFCFFNFRPQARCFAGDVGSVGIAFIIVFVLGRLILQTSDVTYIMLLAVYGVDSVLTIIHRIMLHENLGEAHRKHMYQLLANELEWPHLYVAGLYAGVQLLISAGLLLMPNIAMRWVYSIGVMAILCGIYVWFMKRYFHLHKIK